MMRTCFIPTTEARLRAVQAAVAALAIAATVPASAQQVLKVQNQLQLNMQLLLLEVQISSILMERKKKILLYTRVLHTYLIHLMVPTMTVAHLIYFFQQQMMELILEVLNTQLE